MQRRRTLFIAVLAGAALMAPGSPVGAATSVSGKYNCKPYALRDALVPPSAGLTLKSTGRYVFTYYGANGGTSTGTFKKSGNRLKFSSGPLDGKSGTFHGPGGGSGLFHYNAQITFGSWTNGVGKEVCKR